MNALKSWPHPRATVSPVSSALKGSVLLAASLLVAGAVSAQIAYTGNGTGDWRDAAHWDGVNNVNANTGNYVIPDGFASIAMSSANLSGAGSVVAVQGSSSATFEGFKQLQTITVNFQDASQFLVAGTGAKFGYDVVINYDSSAISDSTGIVFALWRATAEPKIHATINLNSGGLIVGELFFNEAGGEINVDGGDLSAASINLNGNAFTGGINFSSTGGSALTVGTASGAPIGALIADGFLTIDGETEAVSAASFTTVRSGDNVVVTVGGEAGPTWYGYAITDGFADTGSWLGWLYVEQAPWVYSYRLTGWLYAPAEQAVDAGGWFYTTQ